MVYNLLQKGVRTVSKYEAIIFDLDGTILDTIEDLRDSVNHALFEHGFPQRSLEEVRSFVGNGIRKLIERALPAGLDDKTVDSVFNCFNLYYKEHCMDKSKPYEGTIFVIKTLRDMGKKTAVLSNKADYAVQMLCENYFPDSFDYIAGMKENVRRKPWPDGVLNVLEALETAAEKAVYIGDSEVDILTAKNAGIDCIAVDWGFRDREVLIENGAEMIASNTKELLEIFVNGN